MESMTINTGELKLIYKAIIDKIISCIDKMIDALNNENEEEFEIQLEIQLEKYNKLMDMRIRYLQKIGMIKEILREVEEIAEQANKI